MEFRHELVIPNDDLPFKMFIFEGKDGNHYKVSKHWHQSVEIFLVTDGEIDFYIDSRNYPLKRHQFVIVNSNEIHSIECPHPNNTIVLQIPVEMFDGYYGSEPYIMFGEGTREDKQVLTKLVEEMYQVYEQCEYGYDLKDAQINYCTYLMDLRVKYAVRELMNTDHEIGDIAMGHGFPDSRAFAKAFRKRYGCLPSEYRRGLKA